MIIEIKYFSSTGNTLWMARFAKEYLEKKGHRVRLSNTETEGMEFRRDSEIVGLFYPVWGSNLPGHIEKSILKIQPGRRKMFLIGNCACFTGDTGIHWKRKIEKHLGFDVYYIDHIVLPMNVNIPNFNWLKVPNEQSKERQFKKAEKKLQKIADGIVAFKRKQRGYNPFGAIGAATQRYYEKRVYYAWQKMMAIDSAKCTDCNICSKICPMDNITINNNTLQKGADFYNKCIFCLRCYNLCPQNAYLIGDATKDLARYTRYKGAYQNTVKEILEDRRK